MRLSCLFLALVASQAAAWSQVPRSPAGEHRSRREALARALPNGAIVLFGRAESATDDVRIGFFQESNFYYLTGWKEPGAILLVESGAAGVRRETLFLPERDAAREKWTGPRTAPSDADARQLTGFESVMKTADFEGEARAALERAHSVYSAGSAGQARVEALAKPRPVESAEKALARLRAIKSPYELELIERAIEATMAAHRAAWKLVAPGAYEYQVAAAMTGVYFGRGCERSAYTPIVGSGPNSVFLDYSLNSRKMEGGDVLVMDVGAECGGYAADVTRTAPVGGRFSKRQRELYEVVLGAQKAAIAAVKPGAFCNRNQPNSIYRAAYEYIDSHGKDLHGNSLGKYFIHGIGHSVGLDVHDAWEPAAPLEEGMVITIEPGVYLPEERIGIRIEDMVLVTRDGARLLTAALPREAAAIEKAVTR